MQTAWRTISETRRGHVYLGQPGDVLVPQRADDRSDLVAPLLVPIGDQHTQPVERVLRCRATATLR